LDAQFAKAIMGDGKFEVRVQFVIVHNHVLNCALERPRIYG
jgi:hypothetical protein